MKKTTTTTNEYDQMGRLVKTTVVETVEQEISNGYPSQPKPWQNPWYPVRPQWTVKPTPTVIYQTICSNDS